MRRLYYILSAILLAAIATLMCIYDKGTLHLMLCDHHTAAGDVFFPAYTQVAEWGIYVVAVLIMLFYKLGWGCFMLVSNWVAGGIGQIFKHIVKAPRPVTWFAQHYPDVQLPAIEGIEFKEWLSFPSGHTTTFFCLFLVLTLVIEEIIIQRSGLTAKRSYSKAVLQRSGLSAAGGLFALATLGAYSRIYMSMHFAEDIFAGIILGVGITALLSLLIPKLQDTRFWNVSIRKSLQANR